jgi:hypothetical protein
MLRTLFLSLLLLQTGCTVVSQNRVFPKLSWYWSDDAKAEREYRRQEKERDSRIP